MSGYYSHVSEWEDSINISDGAIFFCDQSGANEGIYFTTEILQRIGPLICEKVQKKQKNKKLKNCKFDKNGNPVNKEDFNNENNNTIIRELRENPIPVFVLVTKSRQDLDLTNLKQEVNKYLPNVQKEYCIISDFNQSVYKVFDWFQNILVEKKKK